MSTETTETPQTQTPEQAVEAVLNNVDFDKLTPEQVFNDILHQTKMFAMRLMVGVALLEKLATKQGAEQPIQDQPNLDVVRDEETT